MVGGRRHGPIVNRSTSTRREHLKLTNNLPPTQKIS